MWLVDPRSPRSDAEWLGGPGQESFQSKAAHRGEYAFTRSQHGLRVAVGVLLLSCFVVKRRYDLLVRARRWIPQAALIDLSVLVKTRTLTGDHEKCLLCSVRDDRCPNHLSVYHRP